MARSRISSERLPPRRPRSAFARSVILAALGVCGCSNSCFVGFSNNGNGGFIIVAGNPPPTCSLTLTHGMVRAKVAQRARCEFCTDSARVEHVYVTLRGVQLHASAIADADSPDWVEIAPHLAHEPVEMDLMNGTGQEVLVGSSMILAGSYRQVRLQFVEDRPREGGRAENRNACAAGRQNCAVRADGSEETFYWPDGVPEVVIRGEGVEGHALTVLPNTMVELRISLEPQPVDLLGNSGGWTSEEVLVGRVVSVR